MRNSDAAAARCPDVPESRLDGFLAQLIRHGYLLTSITPQRVDADLLDRIEAAVSDFPELRARLRGIRSALDDYATAEAGKGEDTLRRLLHRIDPDGELPRPPIQVDLRVDATVVLPEAVAEEAQRYASAMWAISAALALGRDDWHGLARASVLAFLASPREQWSVGDTALCHGWSGLLHLLGLLNRHLDDERLTGARDEIVDVITARFDEDLPFGLRFTAGADIPGFLEGSGGVALALDAYAEDRSAVGWDEALLVA